MKTIGTESPVTPLEIDRARIFLAEQVTQISRVPEFDQNYRDALVGNYILACTLNLPNDFSDSDLSDVFGEGLLTAGQLPEDIDELKTTALDEWNLRLVYGLFHATEDQIISGIERVPRGVYLNKEKFIRGILWFVDS